MAMFGGKSASVSAARETPASWATRGIAKAYGMFGLSEQEAWRRAQQLSTALQAVTPLGVADVAYQDTQNLMAGRKRDPLGVALAAIPGAPAARKAIGKAAKEGGELAMDAASRMARARAMGFDVDTPLYHTRFADYDTINLGKAGGGHTIGKNEPAFFLTDSARNADSYTGRMFVKTYADGWDKEKVEALRSQVWDAHKRAEALPPYPIEWRTRPDIPPHAVKAFDDWERGVAEAKGQIAELEKTWDAVNGIGEVYPQGANIMPAYARGNFAEVDMQGGQYRPELVEREIRKARRRGKDGVKFLNMYDWGGAPGSVSAPQTTYAVINPEVVRARFAAFDPAKKNISNIMAGVGGFGLLGAGFMPREEQNAPPPKVVM